MKEKWSATNQQILSGTLFIETKHPFLLDIELSTKLRIFGRQSIHFNLTRHQGLPTALFLCPAFSVFHVFHKLTWFTSTRLGWEPTSTEITRKLDCSAPVPPWLFAQILVSIRLRVGCTRKTNLCHSDSLLRIFYDYTETFFFCCLIISIGEKHMIRKRSISLEFDVSPQIHCKSASSFFSTLLLLQKLTFLPIRSCFSTRFQFDPSLVFGRFLDSKQIFCT